MKTTIPNLNKTPVQEYGNLFDQLCGMIVFDKHQFLDVGRSWKQELQELLEKDWGSEAAKRILDLENRRQEQFEKVLDPLDDALNLSFDDWRNRLDKYNLEYVDVLCRNPQYAAAFKICNKNKFGYPEFETSHDTTGHLWKEESYRAFLTRLQSHDFSEELEFLNIKKEATELLLIDISLNKAVRENNFQESLDALRKYRDKFSSLFGVLFMEVYTSEQRYKKTITVTTEEMIADELEQEQYQKSLQEFSTNDLPYSQFSHYISLFNDDTIPEILQEIWEKIIKEHISLFQEIYQAYPQLKNWNELEQSECTLFRAIERLFVDLGLLIHSPATDYSEEYEKTFYKSKRHRCCSELFDDLIELDVGADGFRGVTLDEGDLPKIITCFSNPVQLEKLEYLGLKKTFLEIVDADLRSRELWDESLQNENISPLDDLREARWRVCKGVGLLTADIFNKEE